jgi:hypothetical protein
MTGLALTLLLSGPGPAATPPENLDFRTGTFTGWENRGTAFRITVGRVRAVTSSDQGPQGHTGVLRKVLVLPRRAGEIRFQAYAVAPGEDDYWPGDAKLNVILAGAGKRIIPKEVRTKESWTTAPLLLPPEAGKPREYRWDVAAHAGRTVQLIIGDQDKRPGAYLYCTGFRVLLREDTEAKTFSRFMVKLAKEHQLIPPARYDSRHFTALSNADEGFTKLRLNNCELIYHLFFDHFRGKGFALHKPPAKLMVAIFDSQAGFEAYLGQKMPLAIVGIYHPGTNRFVVYDFGTNDAFVAGKRAALRRGQMLRRFNMEKRYVETVERLAREYRSGANIGTTMHEVAHQLSFNMGMLNRRGDVPAWLAEGLACYCEATQNDYWLGIGEPNPGRLGTLAAVFAGRGRLVPLRDLLAGENWRMTNSVLAGYAQSWALFKWLLEEKPRSLRKYLRLIYDRRAPDHRLTDFGQVFGSDLRAMEFRFDKYLRQIVDDYKETHR